MRPARYARCTNEIEVERPVFTYVPCLGLLAFAPEDRDAACDTCGARCGSLVADYIGGDGPWPEAVARWREDVAALWREDHDAGHMNGAGNCPVCWAATTRP